MTVELESSIPVYREFYVDRASELMHDTSRYAQQTAMQNARRRSGELEEGIELHGSGLDYAVVATAGHSIYNEFGTGIYAEGQSRAHEIPWVYYDEYLGEFFTTYGLKPQPFMRPGYEAGKEFLYGRARSYFDG